MKNSRRIDTLSASAFEEAKKYIPGGVNSAGRVLVFLTLMAVPTLIMSVHGVL
jgi:glutamate-1-semialdehyde aminotransferase